MWKNNKKIWLHFIGILAGAAVLTGAVCGIDTAVTSYRTSQVIAKHEPVNIVVLGDSIWDLVRDDTGIAANLERDLGKKATIYNCAIKGSRAAAAGGVREDGTEQNDICLCAMARYITGVRADAIPEQYEAKTVLSQVDFNQVDYVLIAYGLNDYFGGVKLKNPDNCYDVTTYEGALCSSIEMIRNAYPNVKFMILSPTYCQGYSYGQVVHESNSYSYGGGTCLDYVSAAEEIADAYQIPFVNNTEALQVSIHNGPQYLADATHLSEIGREKYAANLAAAILKTY